MQRFKALVIERKEIKKILISVPISYPVGIRRNQLLLRKNLKATTSLTQHYKPDNIFSLTNSQERL